MVAQDAWEHITWFGERATVIPHSRNAQPIDGKDSARPATDVEVCQALKNILRD